MKQSNLPATLQTELIVPTKAWITALKAVKEIESYDDYQAFAKDRKLIKDKIKELEESRKVYTQPLDDQKKAIMEAVRPVLALLDKEEKDRLRILRDWDDKKAEEIRKQQALLEARLREQEAVKLLERGKEEAAEAVLSGETVVAVPQLKEPGPLPGTGVNYRTAWHGLIINFPAFVKWCVKTEQLHLLAPNQREIDALARLKGPLSDAGSYPEPDGVRWVSEKIMVQR